MDPTPGALSLSHAESLRRLSEHLQVLALPNYDEERRRLQAHLAASTYAASKQKGTVAQP